jgi:hypothetical protein
METQFKHLSLGARFSFIGQLDKTFVKLNNIQVVEWDSNEVIKCFKSPYVSVIAHPEVIVEVRERYPETNYHEFPKTAYKEGYDHYIVHPRWSDNPYTKDSQEFLDFQRGYLDADWEDTI